MCSLVTVGSTTIAKVSRYSLFLYLKYSLHRILQDLLSSLTVSERLKRIMFLMYWCPFIKEVVWLILSSLCNVVILT